MLFGCHLFIIIHTNLRLQIQGRDIPVSVDFDKCVLGYIFVNRATFKSISSFFPEHDEDDSPLPPGAALTTPLRPRRTRAQLCGALLAWMKTLVGSPCGFPFPALAPLSDGPQTTGASQPVKSTQDSHVVSEAYSCSLDAKCYAQRRDQLELYTMYRASLPTFALRTYSKDVFEKLARFDL